MFIHNFKYTLKRLLKDRILIFWTFAFPLILGTFFNLAFSNIENKEKLGIIDIAVVNNEQFKNNQLLKESIQNLSTTANSYQLFNTSYVTLNKAKALLEEEKITGYIVLDESIKVVVMTNGINETIINQVVEEIKEKELIIENIVAKKLADSKNEIIEGTIDKNWIATIYNDALKALEKNKANIVDTSSNNLSYTMIEFYTLIAMTCLYGGILGMVALTNILANMSSTGKRVSVSKASKLELVISSALASYLVQLLGLLLLFIYTIFILKIDYGSNFLYIIILALVGSLAGLSLGIALASVLKTGENEKTGIIISVTMLGCFLSGMMGITMKYIVDKNIPLLNKINPASMITEGFYTLYYYDSYNRYYFNVISLLIFSLIMFSLAINSLRRQKYDSI